MPKASRVGGATSNIFEVFIQDTTSALGAGLTGLTNSTCGTLYYKRSNGTASVQVATINTISTLGTFAGTATQAAFKEVDSTNMPGVYELQVPDNALASGAKNVVFMLKGGTNAAPCPVEIEITGTDNQDSVRYGMTALPNATAGAAGGVLLVGNMRQQKNAALSNLAFYMADSSGAPKTGLTITSNISKDGGAMTGTSNSATEISSGLGWYKISLTQTEMNADMIALSFAGSGALNTNILINTQVD